LVATVLGFDLSVYLATPSGKETTNELGRNRKLLSLVHPASAAVKQLKSFTGIIATKPKSTVVGSVTTATQALASLGTIWKAS
jgi:hypothetical protein